MLDDSRIKDLRTYVETRKSSDDLDQFIEASLKAGS
jgi:hypothetical protein